MSLTDYLEVFKLLMFFERNRFWHFRKKITSKSNTFLTGKKKILKVPKILIDLNFENCFNF